MMVAAVHAKNEKIKSDKRFVKPSNTPIPEVRAIKNGKLIRVNIASAPPMAIRTRNILEFML